MKIKNRALHYKIIRAVNNIVLSNLFLDRMAQENKVNSYVYLQVYVIYPLLVALLLLCVWQVNIINGLIKHDGPNAIVIMIAMIFLLYLVYVVMSKILGPIGSKIGWCVKDALTALMGVNTPTYSSSYSSLLEILCVSCIEDACFEIEIEVK